MARIPLETILSRATRLRCPRCGEGKLFKTFLRMHEICSHCQLKYERAAGYFLGSIYINYAITAITITVGYVVFHMILEYENSVVLPPIVAFCILFPLVFLRYARSFWLGLDCFFDVEGFGLNEESPPTGSPGNNSSDP